MLTLTDVARSVAANTTTGNILDGKTGRFMNRETGVRIYATSVAVGILISVLAGNEGIAVDDQEISAANRFPLRPDDLTTEFMVVPENPPVELIIRLRNRTGAAVVATTLVDLL